MYLLIQFRACTERKSGAHLRKTMISTERKFVHGICSHSRRPIYTFWKFTGLFLEDCSNSFCGLQYGQEYFQTRKIVANGKWIKKWSTDKKIPFQLSSWILFHSFSPSSRRRCRWADKKRTTSAKKKVVSITLSLVYLWVDCSPTACLKSLYSAWEM